ncbi:MAG: transposase [Acidobacteria bacterium]|nr:transposase [Acidobacteriota bacterium]
MKNSYVRFYGPENLSQLRQMTEKAVNMYNNYKPHTALNSLKPRCIPKSGREP